MIPLKGSVRIMVDQLWQGAVKKVEAKVDAWMKEMTSSPGLRKWFNHEAQNRKVLKNI